MGLMLMLIRIVTTCADSILQVKENEEFPRAEQYAGGITWHSYSSLRHVQQSLQFRSSFNRYKHLYLAVSIAIVWL